MVKDKRVSKIYKDIDGWWIELTPGFIVSDDQTHGITEDTKRAALNKLALVVPCDCPQCQHEMARA